MATKSFQAGDLADADGDSLTAAAKPSATHMEADIDLNNDRTLAMSWNKTKDADTQLGLARKILRCHLPPAHHERHRRRGGTDASNDGYDGVKSKSVTAQLSYEF